MAGRLILVGGGKMGGALLAGWLARGEVTPDRVTVVEPSSETCDILRERHGVQPVADADSVAANPMPDAVILAVKPQLMDQVAPAYRSFADRGALILSIAAGKTVADIERSVGGKAAVVRAMPNTPASIGRGMTVACANRHVDEQQQTLCGRLLTAVGDMAWLDDETLMDAVTGVSGSGPAYVFWMIECLADAGVAAGLPRDLADRLARATVAGAGELAWRAEESATTLRENVTSPQGTTAAALEVLMASDGLAPLMKRAVAAAADRSRALSGG
ncbi:MAG: pyrroline-5-carboxylate reductase [Rhodospirillaceae bacterium]|nr:pyrroline-5-carboxylate reductase [Rhodospirillaceae bacterium]